MNVCGTENYTCRSEFGKFMFLHMNLDFSEILENYSSDFFHIKHPNEFRLIFKAMTDQHKDMTLLLTYSVAKR